MSVFSRKTLQSGRARMRRIDRVFERVAQCYFVAFFLFLVISWSTHLEAFRIDNVVVRGTHAISAKTVKNIAMKYLSETILWKIDRNNAVFYPKDNLSLALRSLDAHVKSVGLKVENNKTLMIDVAEFEPKHLWCETNDDDQDASTSPANVCYLADEDGYIFSDSPDYSGYPFDVYRTNIAGAAEQGTPVGLFMLPKEELPKVYAVIGELETIGVFVHEIDQIDEHDYSFKSGKPWAFLWSSEKDPKESVANLKLATDEIAKKQIGTTTVTSIDLRFGNKIFYK